MTPADTDTDGTSSIDLGQNPKLSMSSPARTSTKLG